ncbi:tetratricopeptide repeat protein [Campylobacter mucosalis]|uniref:tetratricopeptide repeat protein n=1 Tax=Campylobacter mucosalis TaxID=202 RepID=UPI001470406A|nr:hypothetical protein [Campylobacter mucosalis]
MNKILAVLLYPFFLFGFTLSINSGAENGKPYSILTLSDEREFECVEQILAYDTKRYACMFDDDGMVNIDDVDLALMDIRYKKQDGKLFVVILPKVHSRLINLDTKLYENRSVFKDNSRISKKFSILVDSNLKEFDENAQNGVNFAPKFDDMLLPSIGALDFSRAPIEGMDSNDIDLYISIKKAYDTGFYPRVLEDSTSAISRHPNSIFASEFLLYRLRAMSKILESNENNDDGIGYENIVTEGKAWMRKFTADENYPEVLYVVGRAYLKQSMLSDAKYIMDMLSSEYSNSNFSKLSMLEYADEIYKNSKVKEAVKLYEDVLYSAKDIDLASRAALSLTDASIDKNKVDEARDYIIKILNANSKFFLANEQKAMELANTFANNQVPQIAAKIYEIIVDKGDKKGENYEVALKNLGELLVQMKDVDRAYSYLQRYKSEFKYGEYTAQVQTALDKLFFERNDDNSTALHQYYAELMQRYEKSEIGVKALLGELELSYKEKKYPDVLRFTSNVKDLNLTRGFELLNLSALMLAKQGIKANDCQVVINLIEAYDVNILELPQFKLHDCFKRTSRFERALNLAKAHINDENLEDRIEWLVKLSSDLRQLKRFEESVKVANDALSLGVSMPYSDPSPVLFDRFYSLLKLDKFGDAIRTLGAIEELRGQDFKIIEVYDTIAKYAFAKNDYANTTTYAKKALSLANKARIDTFTPELNFLYATASLKMENLNDALDEAKYILSLKLNPNQRARALNLISNVYITQKRPDLAVPYLKECVLSNIQSEHKSLCEASLKMIQP